MGVGERTGRAIEGRRREGERGIREGERVRNMIVIREI